VIEVRLTACAVGDTVRPVSEKAEARNPHHLAVPFAGFVRAVVAEGDEVVAGQVVAVVEAMKMEAPVVSANAGTVARLVIGDPRQAEGGDLLLVLS
jgi:pyruvate carboxylase